MKIAVAVCRTILGLGFVVFGLNIMHPFLPQPPPPEGSLAAHFIGVMGPTHWMSVVGFIQFLGGVLVLLGGTAPMGLVLLAPVLVNILLFHICLMNGNGIVPGVVFSVFEAFLIFSYRGYFLSLFTTKARPTIKK
jgi:putative oxidoreductase